MESSLMVSLWRRGKRSGRGGRRDERGKRGGRVDGGAPEGEIDLDMRRKRKNGQIFFQSEIHYARRKRKNDQSFFF